MVLKRLHLRFWFTLHMIEAYLAHHRGETILCAEHENDARRYESELQRLEILR